jgi:hypothetical protein
MKILLGVLLCLLCSCEGCTFGVDPFATSDKNSDDVASVKPIIQNDK